MTTKVQLAMKALELQGLSSSIQRLFDSTMDALSKLPTVSAAELRTLRERGEDRMNVLVLDLALAAAAILSEVEMQALIDFYESPIGRNIRAKMPQLESAGKTMGMRWCEGLMEDLPDKDV